MRHLLGEWWCEQVLSDDAMQYLQGLLPRLRR
jgi:hypothetical protein